MLHNTTLGKDDAIQNKIIMSMPFVRTTFGVHCSTLHGDNHTTVYSGVTAILPTPVSHTPISPTYYHLMPFCLLMQNVKKSV